MFFNFLKLDICIVGALEAAPVASIPLPESSGSVTNTTAEESSKPPLEDDAFVAFARVFSGKLRVGLDLYVLGPKHNPSTVLNKVSLK